MTEALAFVDQIGQRQTAPAQPSPDMDKMTASAPVPTTA
jgi:hypothetical protein